MVSILIGIHHSSDYWSSFSPRSSLTGCSLHNSKQTWLCQSTAIMHLTRVTEKVQRPFSQGLKNVSFIPSCSFPVIFNNLWQQFLFKVFSNSLYLLLSMFYKHTNRTLWRRRLSEAQVSSPSRILTTSMACHKGYPNKHVRSKYVVSLFKTDKRSPWQRLA